VTLTLANRTVIVGIMPTDVLIPARNEATTIGDVVKTFRASPGIAQVIVVDDGSTDDTAVVAKDAGAYVVKGEGIGKGEAVTLGLGYVYTERVIFCDADLLNFTVDHVALLCEDYDGMIRGYSSRKPAVNNGQRSMPVTLPRTLGIALHGFYMEQQLNMVASWRSVPIKDTELPGVLDAKQVAQGERYCCDWNRLGYEERKRWLMKWARSYRAAREEHYRGYLDNLKGLRLHY
jgi:GTP:adenosylcobinamide-phosphate guanylyltransferase